MIAATNAATAYLRATTDLRTPGTSNASLAEGARDFERVLDGADRASQAAMTGTADTNQLVQALTEAELALDGAVAIRDKVVEAYQEILRMPV